MNQAWKFTYKVGNMISEDILGLNLYIVSTICCVVVISVSDL